MAQLTARRLGFLLSCRSASPKSRTLCQVLILLAGGRHSLLLAEGRHSLLLAGGQHSLLLAGGRHSLLLVCGVALSPSVPTAASILAGPSVGNAIVGVVALFSWETWLLLEAGLS